MDLGDFTTTDNGFVYYWGGEYGSEGMTRFGYRMTAVLDADGVWTVEGVVLREDGSVVTGYTQTGRSDSRTLVNLDNRSTDDRELCRQVAYGVAAPQSNIGGSIYHYQWNALLGAIREWVSAA